uniref:Uncharacterized protein LOC102807949 n=1 Tax=Saccoglossus kowalevskii TaxID=10224 RepID=A0ABM0MUA2_SACKO|nr:PREDICTED: uncharacterized protein LOC102807949 [Saccoglossus kowalevskii]
MGRLTIIVCICIISLAHIANGKSNEAYTHQQQLFRSIMLFREVAPMWKRCSQTVCSRDRNMTRCTSLRPALVVSVHSNTLTKMVKLKGFFMTSLWQFARRLVRIASSCTIHCRDVILTLEGTIPGLGKRRFLYSFDNTK